MISMAIILAEPSSSSGAGLSAFLLLPEWTPVLALNPNPFSSFAMQLCPALGQPKPKTACQLMEHGRGLHPAGFSSFSAPSASCYLFALGQFLSNCMAPPLISHVSKHASRQKYVQYLCYHVHNERPTMCGDLDQMSAVSA